MPLSCSSRELSEPSPLQQPLTSFLSAPTSCLVCHSSNNFLLCNDIVENRKWFMVGQGLEDNLISLKEQLCRTPITWCVNIHGPTPTTLVKKISYQNENPKQWPAHCPWTEFAACRPIPFAAIKITPNWTLLRWQQMRLLPAQPQPHSQLALCHLMGANNWQPTDHRPLPMSISPRN